MQALRTSSWTLIILLCAYCCLAGASLGKVIPLIPDIIRSVSAGPLQVSLLLSVVAVMAVLLAPLAGWIGDRFGDRLLLLCGLSLLAVGGAAGALSGDYDSLLIGRCGEGAGFIFMLTGAAALMMRTTRGPMQATGMALFGASIPAGIGISEALAGLVAGGNWRLAFWGHCVAVGIGILALGFVPPWQRALRHAGSKIGALDIYRQPNPLRLGLCLGILTLAQFGTTALLPTYLHAAFGFSLSHAAAFGAVGLMASILGSICAGAVLSRGGNVRMLVFSTFIVFGVAGALVYAASFGAAFCFAASVVFYISGGAANGLILAVLPRAVPDPAMRGRAGGLVNQCSNMGILAAPPVVFALFSAYGKSGMASLVIATAVLPLLIMPIAAISRRLVQPDDRATPEVFGP